MDLFNEDSPVKIAAGGSRGWTRPCGTAFPPTAQSRRKAGTRLYDPVFEYAAAKKNAVSDAVYELAEYIGMQTDGTHLGIAASDESGALSLNLGYFRPTGKAWEAGIDIRYPIHTEKKTVLCGPQQDEGAYRWKFSRPPHYVPEDSPLVVGSNRHMRK